MRQETRKVITTTSERPKPGREQCVTSLTREILRFTVNGLAGILGSKRGIIPMLPSQYK